ncbi:Xylosyl- and glucuronyltransferase LARGE2s [Acropora cervicornis]|uniref:Xylosyl- and glucuronyltransferase LARGE2s n=1 Tax=Acropora cervicornis TaxID=6130 RepID=A0AAD9PVA5_ACRCE|nr:Xylosyl- and glucuronyltransferase LARGE2s [Acropora cervicornis]
MERISESSASINTGTMQLDNSKDLRSINMKRKGLSQRKTEHGLPTEIVTNVKHSKKLEIESPNLLSPYVMESGSLSLRGWWMSHVFSVACTQHRMVETYQYLSLNKSIPIKGIKFHVSTASWKMNYEPFYGVRISDGLSARVRKIDEKESRICPRDERITSVAVMLGCFGYDGFVTFTDVDLRPIYDIKLISNRSISRGNLLLPCQPPSRQPRPKSGDLLTEILHFASSPADFDAITLVTQLTSNRIKMLKRILRFWNGPLSIAIKEIRLGLPTHLFTKFSTLSVIVTYGNEIGPQYPINRLRNIAIRHHILDYNERMNGTDDKLAFVVPAFDGARNLLIRDLPETKEELIGMVKSKDNNTNYIKWYQTNEPYEVRSYQDKYEPYLILRRTPELPFYDQRFTGYGMNKISHVIELALLRISPLSFAQMTDPEIRLKNRLQRFEFLSDLYTKYRIGPCKKLQFWDQF